MIYFSARPITLQQVDTKQYESLRKFRGRFSKNALREDYKDVQQFRTLFTRQLAQTVNANFTGLRAHDRARDDGQGELERARSRRRREQETEEARYRRNQIRNERDAERARYRKVNTVGGATVWEFASEPHHYACPTCWDTSIMMLQPQSAMSGEFYCPRCKTSYPIGPMQPLPPETARRSPNAWG